MTIELIPLLSYVVVSTFTPGPSNISSASAAVLHGYRNTLRFQAGLAAGVFLIMALSGWVSTALLHVFPILEPVLRYAGAAYIFYLAFGVLKATYMFAEQDAVPSGFVQGLLLQVLNPKLVVYAFTVFSAFLAPVTDHADLVAVAAFLLAAISFAATSTWALFGTTIRIHLHTPRLRMTVNILLSLSLAYTAIVLTGIL